MGGSVFGLGITEILIIAIILLLIFGGKRLPKIGKSLGQTVSELRKVKKEISEEKRSTDQTQEDQQHYSESPKSLSHKLVDKVVDQVPGVKEAKNLKGKADKIKDILK